ncbi:hypothetical protein SFRURICE_018989 [Spodoptera frugiperda]|nr:hypothetical protein SFRURICE_018989 [Spodoptera frugiperda]
MSERNSSRLSAYKNAGQGTTDLRRKRAELSVALRKQARDEQLLKRRALSPEAGDEVQEEEVKVYTTSEIVQGLRSNDLPTMTAAARAARRTLSKEQNPPISTMVAAGSAWALGNIAGDGPQTRDSVLAHGALAVLLPLMTCTTPASQLRTAVWTYTDACWALSYLTDGPNERIESVQVTPNLLPRVISLLNHNSAAVRTPALRAIGNMLTGSDEQTDRCLDAGCLTHIITLLRCNKPSLMKEAAWAVSNILAGTQAQIQRAIQAGVLEHLLYVLTIDDIKCRKEAAWAITNLCLGGTPEQLDALLSVGFLEPYCALLNAPDHRAISVVLDGLTNLLQAAVKYGQIEALCLKLEENGTLDQIENLQQHENEQDDPNAQPTQTEEEYQFGTAGGQNINFYYAICETTYVTVSTDTKLCSCARKMRSSIMLCIDGREAIHSMHLAI